MLSYTSTDCPRPPAFLNIPKAFVVVAVSDENPAIEYLVWVVGGRWEADVCGWQVCMYSYVWGRASVWLVGGAGTDQVGLLGGEGDGVAGLHLEAHVVHLALDV